VAHIPAESTEESTVTKLFRYPEYFSSETFTAISRTEGPLVSARASGNPLTKSCGVESDGDGHATITLVRLCVLG
jgi:hypothetical protein